jgi:hypothetical protein
MIRVKGGTAAKGRLVDQQKHDTHAERLGFVMQ